MIDARPGTTFEAFLEGATVGLLGTLGVRLRDPDAGIDIVARRTAGIQEIAAGVYRTTFQAPLEENVYLVIWDEPPSDPAHTYTEELNVVDSATLPGAPPDWAPGIQDVADVLPSRTRDKGGNFLGTFTPNTKPTADRVNRLIGRAVEVIHSRVPVVKASLIGDARELAAIYVGMRIELGDYSDQIGTDKSSYRELKKLFDDGLVALIEAHGGEGSTAADEQSDTGSSSMGAWDFPPTSIGDGIMP